MLEKYQQLGWIFVHFFDVFTVRQILLFLRRTVSQISVCLDVRFLLKFVSS